MLLPVGIEKTALLTKFLGLCFRILGLTRNNSLATFSEARGKDSGGHLFP